MFEHPGSRGVGQREQSFLSYYLHSLVRQKTETVKIFA